MKYGKIVTMAGRYPEFAFISNIFLYVDLRHVFNLSFLLNTMHKIHPTANIINKCIYLCIDYFYFSRIYYQNYLHTILMKKMCLTEIETR